MLTLWGLFQKNFKELIREKKRTILLFALPLLMFIFIFSVFTNSKVEKTGVKPINIGVIDNDKTFYSSALIEAYKGNESFTEFVTINMGDKELKEEFLNGKYDVLIEVPENFSKDLMYFEKNPIQVKIAYNHPIKAIIFKNVVESYEKYIMSVQVAVEVLYDKMEELSMANEEILLLNNKISYELIMTSVGRDDFFNFNEIVNIPSTTSVNYYFIAIIIMFLMYMSIFTAIDLLREKEQMCFKRLRLTKLSIFEYLISKLLSSAVYIFMIVSIWFLIISLATNLVIHNNLIYVVLYIIGCILFAVSFAIFISSLLKRDESVILISNIFIFINAIIGGSVIPLNYMPDVLRSIARITPNYWMIKGMLYLDSNYNFENGIIILCSFYTMSIILTFLAYFRYKKSV